MIVFPGYTDVSISHEGLDFNIYHAKKDDQKVLIKHLSKSKPSQNELSAFEYEYELLKQIDDKYIEKVLDFQHLSGSSYLVVPDTNSRSLEELLILDVLSDSEKIDIAIKMAEALQTLQKNNIIHKAVSLQNFLYNTDTKDIFLINFSISSGLNFEKHVFKSPYATKGEIPYFSPEQTGRVNRNIDYRSDLYSLGVVMYKLICGVLPFEYEDSLELFHAIIALPAQPLTQRVSGTPLMLNAIVMKLLSKEADERYQSSYALIVDLQAYQKRLDENDDSEYTLGEYDQSGILKLSQKLFGREKEINSLLESFDRVSKGKKEIVLVAGYSGVGKSALVSEVHKPITEKKGFYIEGKFDQFQRDKPYFTFIQAFTSWVGMILSESKEEQKKWRDRLLLALGNDAQVIIDLIPAFEDLLGKQEVVEELSGVEAQSRFNFLFSALIASIASRNHPLVLFIDDLQWSDQATLNLIESLFLDPICSYFLLFGAYRDNEVDISHPLIQSTVQMKNEGVEISTLVLGNLEKSDVSMLLSEALKLEVEKVKVLTDLIYKKTAGNAFFVNNMIETLADDKLLVFDFKTHNWTWDIQAINDLNMSDNVVELMSKQIIKFEKQTQKALTLAACLGNRFDLNTLSLVCHTSPQVTADDLDPALRNGLLVPLGDTYKYVAFSDETDKVYYRFGHDRIQQAAYSLLTPKTLPQTHLDIGELLLNNLQEEDLENSLFDIVNHMNIGEALITDASKRRELLSLNYKAALKAKKAVAFEAVHGFLEYCLKYMSEDHWTSEYELSYEIYILKAEIAYMVQDFKSSKQSIDAILLHAKSDVEKAFAQNIAVITNTMQGKYLEAIESGREGLKLAGFALPEDNYDENFGKEMGEINAYLETHSIASLSELPISNEPDVIVANMILMNVGPPAYMAFKPLYPVICSSFVLLGIKHGNTDVTAGAYGNYGIVLAAMMGQFQAGYEFGLASLALDKKFDNKRESCKNNFNFGIILNHWLHPLSKSVAALNRAYDVGVQSGELQFSGYSLFGKLMFSFVRGEPLSDIISQVPASYQFQVKANNQWALDSIGAISFTLYELIGEKSPLIEEKKFLELVSEGEGGHGLCFYKIFQAQSKFIMKEYETSFTNTVEAAEILFNIFGLLPVVDCNYYNSLSLSMLAFKQKGKERETSIAKIKENQEQLKVWADNVNENFLHKYLFVQAQLLWLEGSIEEARSTFNKAIEQALQENFIQDVAIISEYFALFLYENDLARVSKIYFEDALYYYERWGAIAKVESLKSMLADKFKEKIRASESSIEALDYGTIIKSVQLISSDVDIESLGSNYLEIVMENAGASKGVLQVIKKHKEFIYFKKSTEDTSVVMGEDLDMFADSCKLIKDSIEDVSFSLQNVVINDMSAEHKYQGLDYTSSAMPQSIVVLPIVHNEVLMGVIYLENNALKNIFTKKRIDVLEILSSQLGISLENSLLYSDLALQVEERTKALNSSNIELSEAMKNLKNTQNKLIESEKIASLGSLVAGVAHEINTPVGLSITAITTFQDSAKNILKNYRDNTMTKSSFEEFIETTEPLADIIKKNLTHAGNLIKSFKEVAVGQSNEILDTFNFSKAIDQVAMSFGNAFKLNKIDLRVECDKNLELTSYSGAIYQVLTNLISNTIVHAFDKDEDNRLSIVVEEKDSELHLIICDNGKGIPKENLSKVFDPFFTTKMGVGGTGLGLHIIYNIVSQQLQGNISVTSKLDKTCFTVVLPKVIKK